LLSPIRTHNGSCSNWGCPIVVVLGCWFSLTLPLTQPKLSAQDCDRFGAGARCPRDFPRDCNGNGQLDGEDIRTGVSEDCNQNGVPDACEIGSVQFAPQPAFPVGGSPEASTVGDFNGDGLMDLASANSSAKGVSLTLLLNKGSRQFDRADFSVAEAGRLIALTTGDLDADGDLDLVELDRSTLSVFRGDGQGGFRVALDVAVSVGVSGLATGDLNADGAADLLVTERTLDQVAVFISDGASAFREPTVFVVGDAPRAPVLADLNGDGFLDVATANRRSDDLSLLWGAGDGTVTAAPNRIAVGVDSSPDRLVARDFDGDGHVDVATGTPAAILMFRGTGNGGFADGRPFFLPAPNGSPVALTAFDADSDGDLDLIAPRVEPAGFAFILNAGDGTFVQAIDVERRVASAWLAGADLDGDGHADVVESLERENSLQVFWSRDELRISMEQRIFEVPTAPHALTVADMDGDGDLDLPVGTNRDLHILYNDGNGDFEEVVVHPGITIHYVVAVDLDGDGDQDLAGVRHTAELFFNDGGRTFRRQQEFVGLRPFSIRSGDLDGDGRPDLISANEGTNDIAILRNQGAERFLHEAISVGSGPQAAEPGDFDGDGDLDLAVASTRASEIAILWNDAAGMFPERTVVPLPDPFDVTSADFDADGDVDLFVVSSPAFSAFGPDLGSVSLLRNRGDGTFLPPLEIDNGLSFYSAFAGDVDGNGFLDVACGNTTGTVLLYLNDGRGGFERPVSFLVGGGSRFAMPADLDADGDTDLAVLGRHDWNVRVLYNESGSKGAPFLERICTEAEFYEVSTPSDSRGSGHGPSVERLTKYIVPADAAVPDLLEPLIQNVRQYPLSREFLVSQFPERFPALTEEDFERLVSRRATRTYFAGELLRLQLEAGVAYGFSVRGDPAEPSPTLEEIGSAYEMLRAIFLLDAALLYYPDTAAARESATQWANPTFDVLIEEPTPESPDEPTEGTPNFVLEIPPGVVVCGGYLGRQDYGIAVTPEEWYGLKTTVSLRPGELSLRTTDESFEADLFEEVRLGPERELAAATSSGVFRFRRFFQGDVTSYRFEFAQSFLVGEEPYELRLFNLTFQGRDDDALSAPIVVDQEFITRSLLLEGFRGQAVGYSSCTGELLPLWEVQVALADGSSLRFLERHEVPPIGQTGPASLVSAELNLRGVERQVTDYWSLIYAARRHNAFVEYWVLLDPPLVLEGLERPVHIVAVDHPQQDPEVIVEKVRYLDESFAVIASPDVVSFTRDAAATAVSFRRGDPNGDDAHDVLDTLALLDYLFRRGEAPACRKAADANDDGRVNVADAIGILQLLVVGVSLPAPFPDCGVDPTDDRLACETYRACGG
jgi:hypothetical protein